MSTSTSATADPDHTPRATHYREALGDGQAETFECKLRGRDGRAFWVVVNAVVTGRGEAGGAGSGSTAASGSQITFALLDIECRRQAEVGIAQAQAQAQASLPRIIATAPLAIALFDAPSGRVQRLNHMAAMFFGRPVEAVQGRLPEKWFGPDDARSLRADLDAALAQSDGLRRELPRPLRIAPGDDAAEQRVWDVRIVSLDAPAQAQGEAQLLLVASDVTEQRAAEQVRFDAAVSQRELLIKEVHYRIKNKLQCVAGLLLQTAARRPKVAGLISEAVGQVQAIAQVHGLQVGVTGPLRLRPLVEAITASVQRTFGRSVTVAVEGLAPHRFALPEAESIPIALTINELLANAIKHSTPGEIRIVLHCDEARLAISVHNPGQLRAGFSLAQVPPGVSGLGLVGALLPRRTATLTLVQAGIEVEARVVLVPPSITLLEPLWRALRRQRCRAAPLEPGDNEPEHEGCAMAEKGRVLVVDDDRLVLVTVAHGLAQAGYEVIDADNGDDAILLLPAVATAFANLPPRGDAARCDAPRGDAARPAAGPKAAAAVAAPSATSSDLVAMAVGVLMHRYSLQRGPALARLQRQADDEQRSLGDQAGRPVEAVELLARGQG